MGLPAPRPWLRKHAAILAVVVAVVLVAAGVGVLWLGGAHAPRVTVSMSKSVAETLECPRGTGTIYFEIGFDIIAVSGALTTANFGISILNATGSPVAPNATAPAPSPSLPCSSPPPKVWYALLQPPHGSVATFPDADGGWSNSDTAATPISVGCVIEILTPGDGTGTEESLHGYGVNGAVVTFEGNLSFPPYEYP
jgi:hypothetical protein